MSAGGAEAKAAVAASLERYDPNRTFSGSQGTGQVMLALCSGSYLPLRRKPLLFVTREEEMVLGSLTKFPAPSGQVRVKL